MQSGERPLDRPSQFPKLIFLFALPLVGLALALIPVDLLVPRTPAAIEKVVAVIKEADRKFGASAMAASYYVGIAASLAWAACAVTLWWCLTWIFAQGRRELTPSERRFFWGGLIFAFAIPIGFLAGHKPDVCEHFTIDDCVTIALFKNTINVAQDARFAFKWDADVLGWPVFTTYLISSLTVALAAGTTPPTDKAQVGARASHLTIDDRTNTLNTVLFLMTAVLLAALLAAKLRFDVGLATLGAPPTKEAPNAAFAAYQAIASAVTAYWATVLSLCLALVYLPGAYLLATHSDQKPSLILATVFTPSNENFMRLLKLAAILSPPIINKLIELISAGPKGA
jgi:hypothetical protein